MNHEAPEPARDNEDPAEAEELRRIAELNTLPDFARYLMSHGLDEMHAWRVVFAGLRIVRRER